MAAVGVLWGREAVMPATLEAMHPQPAPGVVLALGGAESAGWEMGQVLPPFLANMHFLVSFSFSP